MIAIVDYGMGNLRSVAKGFEKMGFGVEVTSNPQELEQAAGVVLPGVGAFADAMSNLRNRGLVDAIHRVIAAGKPFLGICLGLQLLFEYSEEWGITEGLAVFPGRVRRLPPGLKIPHMGWNTLTYQKSCPLFQGIPDQAAFYFVHSYYVEPADPELTVVTTEYGMDFTSVAAKDNVYGIQFHPEKSSALGLRILENFGRLVEKC
ncbi:Imidazole glycerol phosphate synthase subunit HisH 1 [Sporotomaculum syntrophicum]|uniref:Imidazole glycerol phosphate synthase subunit HisH n=1 Tax=Sporotomaculum syntrophicum TaxID=182264 RepID=A0A9D3AYU4_9FIRM|nr:imidazole glycerol phosphate synthase subunit HisH [Sporotomaculum syntrophicum]KAF1086427.1 Imidazole glycerol phosphate synthase subunit HisH 1 [Sporotomaculum syntrophicum]